MESRSLVLGIVALLLGTFASAQTTAQTTANVGQSAIAEADSFLRRHNANQAVRGLTAAEKTSIAKVLRTPNRTLTDNVISGLVKNPVAWRPGPEGRELLRSVIDSLPEVATVPGSSRALANACHPNAANFRGFGFEAIATAALSRFREPNGDRPRMVRMSADVTGPRGHKLESDGCAVFNGADQRERLVTMKSVGSENALRGAVRKAMSQLSRRNGSQTVPSGQLGKPGIFMLGYSDPCVLQKAQRKDWQAAAQRSGGKLLVLAVDQLSGRVTRLASVAPGTSAQNQARQICRPTPQGHSQGGTLSRGGKWSQRSRSSSRSHRRRGARRRR
jgi:hypothetical protein